MNRPPHSHQASNMNYNPQGQQSWQNQIPRGPPPPAQQRNVPLQNQQPSPMKTPAELRPVHNGYPVKNGMPSSGIGSVAPSHQPSVEQQVYLYIYHYIYIYSLFAVFHVCNI